MVSSLVPLPPINLLVTMSFVEDTSGLIIAVSTLLGVVGSIVVAVASKFASSKAKDIAIQVGEGLKETDKWVLENEQKLVTVLTVAYNLTPQEQKDAAAKYQELIKKYNGDIAKVTEELRKLYGTLEIPQ